MHISIANVVFSSATQDTTTTLVSLNFVTTIGVGGKNSSELQHLYLTLTSNLNASVATGKFVATLVANAIHSGVTMNVVVVGTSSGAAVIVLPPTMMPTATPSISPTSSPTQTSSPTATKTTSQKKMSFQPGTTFFTVVIAVACVVLVLGFGTTAFCIRRRAASVEPVEPTSRQNQLPPTAAKDTVAVQPVADNNVVSFGEINDANGLQMTGKENHKSLMLLEDTSPV